VLVVVELYRYGEESWAKEIERVYYTGRVYNDEDRLLAVADVVDIIGREGIVDEIDGKGRYLFRKVGRELYKPMVKEDGSFDYVMVEEEIYNDGLKSLYDILDTVYVSFFVYKDIRVFMELDDKVVSVWHDGFDVLFKVKAYVNSLGMDEVMGLVATIEDLVGGVSCGEDGDECEETG